MGTKSRLLSANFVYNNEFLKIIIKEALWGFFKFLDYRVVSRSGLVDRGRVL